MVLSHKCDINFAFPKHDLRVTGRCFYDLQPNIWILFVELIQQSVEEPACCKSINADPQFTLTPARVYSGGLDRSIKSADGFLNLIDELASSIGESNAAGVALEENDTKVLFQQLDPGADTRLTGAQRRSGPLETQILGNSQRLDERFQ